MMTVMSHVQDEVDQEDSEQNEVDGRRSEEGSWMTDSEW